MHMSRAPYAAPRSSDFAETKAAPRPTAAAPIPAYKLKKGIEAAKAEINEMIEALCNTMADSFNVSEVELVVSFGSDGKFLGFGAGGAAEVKIRIAPAQI